MEKVVKYEYDETKVKQEMDIKYEYVENGYSLCERSEPVSLVIHPMQINTQNTSQPEDYFFEDVVKSGYGKSERKQDISSIDFSEDTEDNNSVAELTSKPVSLEVDSVQIHIKYTSPGEKLVKSEYDKIERKEETASSDVRSTYTEDSASKPTNELTSFVDRCTFQIKTQHPDWSEEYVVKDEIKSEYDETEFNLENSSIDLESEVFTEDKNSLIEASSDPTSLVMDSVKINTQNISTSEENIFEATVKSQYDEVDHKQQVSSNDLKLEYTQDKYAVADPKNDPVSLVGQNSTCQINTQNADACEDIVKVSYAIQRLDKSVSREISEISSLRGNLKPQQLTRTGEKFFSCDVCSKAFSLKGDLENHTFTHTREKKFSCDICSKTFSLKSVHKRHMLTHTGDKFFSCDICSKTFSWRRDLKRHMFTHTGEKFFSCDVCSKAFSQRSYLKRHMFTHTGEKFFSCDVCSKAFSLKGRLKKHTFTHTGDKCFSCDICSKAFSWRSDLKRHMFTHTGEKFFSCDVCTKAFSRRFHVKRHMFTHTGEKFFSCDVCSKSFTQKSNLKAHLITHRPTGDV